MPSGDPVSARSFAFIRLRLHFIAADSIYFPNGKPGNIVRGAFGTILQSISCSSDCGGAKACSQRSTCSYARIFEPGSLEPGPSGLHDRPRPFVFRASHLNGETILPGRTFHFDVHLFDIRQPSIRQFVLAFAELGRTGLGPRRGRATLISVDQIDGGGEPALTVYNGSEIVDETDLTPCSITLARPSHNVAALRIEFLSPTELKHDDRLASRPEFGVLFARIRDRIATLNALYGWGALGIDFKGLGERAEQIRMTRCNLRHVDVERRSSRTGQRHPIGGFLGTADYEGELAEFQPYLEAAVYAGVGRQTTFGNGEIRLSWNSTKA